LAGPTPVLLSYTGSTTVPLKHLDFPIKEARSKLEVGEREKKRRMTDEIHRTTPIEDSIERIAPYPANFFVYKIPGSKFYQASARLNGVRAKKSHKTKSRTIARQVAKEFFDAGNVAPSNGLEVDLERHDATA
jgi:hypothetical protein